MYQFLPSQVEPDDENEGRVRTVLPLKKYLQVEVKILLPNVFGGAIEATEEGYHDQLCFLTRCLGKTIHGPNRYIEGLEE